MKLQNIIDLMRLQVVFTLPLIILSIGEVKAESQWVRGQKVGGVISLSKDLQGQKTQSSDILFIRLYPFNDKREKDERFRPIAEFKAVAPRFPYSFVITHKNLINGQREFSSAFWIQAQLLKQEQKDGFGKTFIGRTPENKKFHLGDRGVSFTIDRPNK